MIKKRKQRLCSRFYCNIREGRFCCADCKLKPQCKVACLNDPSRCKLEDRGKQ